MRKWAAGTLILLFAAALFGPLLSPPDQIQLHLKNLPPCKTFWFGTDDLGRDLFTRFCLGGRISLFIGGAAALVDLGIGVLWGSAASLAGGRAEESLMRICDILATIPHTLIAMLLAAVFGPGIGTILLAIILTGWIGMARIARSQILKLKECTYAVNARALGASPARILWRHLLPNAKAPICAAVALAASSALFTESFLSFLGLGLQPPAASWGAMINDSLSSMRYYPWRWIFPAAGLSLAMFSFHFLAKDNR